MSTGRRRSKWDQPAPLPAAGAGVEAERQPATRAVPPPEAAQQEADRGSVGGEDGEGPKGGSQVEAARAAARINAMLAAQGKLGSSEMPPMQSSPSSVASSIRPEPMDSSQLKLKSASVDINDSPARIELMKSSFLAEINKKSGAILTVKGQYMPALEKEQALARGDKALHLHIQAPQQSNVDLAVKLIAEATAKARAGILNLGPQAPPFFPSGQHYVQDKVFIGLDEAPEEFHLHEKLQGPGNSFFEHIMSKTKARIHLRGRGSGYMEPTSGRESFEALYIYLQHSTPEGLKEARTLCDDLVKHVQKEYGTFKQQRTAYRPPFPYTPFPGYGPLGYFGPPTNPGPFQVPPPPGYFPPPQPYTGPGCPDPSNAGYFLPPGGYHGYNPPPSSGTGPADPTIPKSTETSSDTDKDVSEKKEEAPKRRFTEKPLAEVKSVDSKKRERSTVGSEEDVKGSEKDGVGSTNDQETILDSKVVGESHQDSEENEENISTENKMDDGLSQKDDSGTVGGASKPSFTSMPPPSIPVARLTRIGEKRGQQEPADIQPEPKVLPKPTLVMYDSDSDSEDNTP